MMHGAPILVVLVLAVVGCQSSPGPTFAVDDIAALLLQPSEAPSGTTYSEDASGPATLGEVAQGDPDLQAGWEDLGFMGGRVALFTSDPAAAESAFVVIGTAGLVFPHSDAAGDALELHRSVGVPNLTIGAEEVSVEGLGDEAFAVTFDFGPAGTAGAICGFRVGNAMFLVAGSGESITAEDLVAIARTIAGRAQA